MSRFLLFALALGLIYSVSPASINAQEKKERSHASNMRTTQDDPTDDCPGSAVSRYGFLQDRVVQCLISNQLLQLRVLTF